MWPSPTSCSLSTLPQVCHLRRSLHISADLCISPHTTSAQHMSAHLPSTHPLHVFHALLSPRAARKPHAPPGSRCIVDPTPYGFHGRWLVEVWCGGLVWGAPCALRCVGGLLERLGGDGAPAIDEGNDGSPATAAAGVRSRSAQPASGGDVSSSPRRARRSRSPRPRPRGPAQGGSVGKA